MTLLQPSGVPLSDDALRIGLITDRFEAGHKLKTLAYVANNQIVLSFAELALISFIFRITIFLSANLNLSPMSRRMLALLRTFRPQTFASVSRGFSGRVPGISRGTPLR